MSRLEAFKPYAAQLAVQGCYAGMNIIVRVALQKGMNHFIFVFYRQAVATLAMAPFAYFLERKERPPMTCGIFWKIFGLAFCGICLNQNLYFAGLADTSATFASATTNLIPIFTFIMAVALRSENVVLRTKRGQAKVIGTIICVGGALIMTLYKGPTLGVAATLNLHDVLRLDTWIYGALMLFASAICWSGWLVFQDPVVKMYPTQKSFTELMLLMGTVQSLLMGLLFERDLSAWKLKWDMELLSIVYSGVLCSAFAFFMQTYCINEKGPVFAAVFNPVATIVVAVLDLVVLHVKLHVGSLVGGILIIAGLYAVLWGKAKDEKKLKNQRNDSTKDIEDCPIEIKEPLLENDGEADRLLRRQQSESQSEGEISHR
uniref:WAT1-related protein n=2 Tax=Wollemia nobilis TaxID=56998 RepID=A0A0C9S8J2_9CONI